MKYAEWIESVPCEIANDPIWKLEVYRLALFAGDIGWNDVLVLSKKPMMLGVADQLHRSLGSISANLTEGYSRSKGLDRARFLKSRWGQHVRVRDWYFKARRALPTEVLAHRMALITQIIGMLTAMIPHQRAHAIREREPDYGTPVLAPTTEIPIA